MQGFPAALSSFIGRAGAVRDVVALLGECRLVTVTGPGGVGKTRLADQVAGRFADGARLAELAAVRSGLGPGGGGRGAGIPEQPGVPAGEALARVLGRQQLLLVLANCEHVIGAVVRWAAGGR
jgi:predicted ATPase